MEPNVEKVSINYAINAILVFSLPLLGLVSITWGTFAIAYAVFFVMNVLGVTATFHRHLSHRAFQFKYKAIEYLFILFGTLSCSGSPVGGVMTHRDHHKFSDTSNDPHEGALGFWKLQAVLYNVPGKEYRSGVRDVITNRFCMNMHRYYYAILAAYALALYSVWGIAGMYFGFFLPAAMTLFSEGMINWAAHQDHFGYRNFDTPDKSRNLWWINIASHGDGWHNNHHDKPDNYTTKSKWWEFDLTGHIIKLVRA
jgi:fatty-acid desaturase